MSGWENILVERKGSLGKITLNRPEARNSLDNATAREVLDGLNQHFGDPQVRRLVMRFARGAT